MAVAEAESDFMKNAVEVMETAAKFKKVMNKKKLFRAKTKCPRCGSWLHASIARYNNHIHMSCEGKCGMSMME